MNILFYLHQFPAIGGIETVTATLANYFTSRGHDVTIVSLKGKTNARETVALDSRVCALQAPEESHYSKANRDFLQKMILARNIDIVIFQDTYSRVEANLFCGDVKAAVVVAEHSCPFYMFWHHIPTKRPIVAKILGWMRPVLMSRRMAKEKARKRFLYEKSTRYVLLSDRFFGEFRAMTHLWDTRKLRAIPNPVLPSAFLPQREKKNEIVFASSLNWDKGLQRVLPIWKEIAVQRPDWRFTVVGDGEMMAWARKYIADNHVAHVSLEGYRTNCAEYFARAKILVYPSSREGWGLILVEAMANGCVPIAFDSYAAVRDIIDDGQNGMLVPAYDIEAFGSSLKAIMCDASRLAGMSAAAKKKAEKFAVEKVGACWDELLEEILETCK